MSFKGLAELKNQKTTPGKKVTRKSNVIVPFFSWKGIEDKKTVILKDRGPKVKRKHIAPHGSPLKRKTQLQLVCGRGLDGSKNPSKEPSALVAS